MIGQIRAALSSEMFVEIRCGDPPGAPQSCSYVVKHVAKWATRTTTFSGSSTFALFVSKETQTGGNTVVNAERRLRVQTGFFWIRYWTSTINLYSLSHLVA